MKRGLPQRIWQTCQYAAAHTGRFVKPWVTAAADFLAPATCALCSSELPQVAGQSQIVAAPGFCQTCQDEFEAYNLFCRRCGGPIGPNLPVEDCPLCRPESFAFGRVYSAGLYEKRMRGACLQAQESSRTHLAAALAELLWKTHQDDLKALAPALIVPVPRRWWKRVRRSYYVPDVMAEVLAGRLGARVDRRAVVKIRHTPDQNSLSPTERRTNLRGAFKTAPGLSLAGKKVLIVDDVLTTGSTAHEIAKALLAAGAARIDVAVIARGVGLLRLDRQAAK